MGKSFGSSLFIHRNSNILNGTSTGEEFTYAILCRMEANITNKDGRGSTASSISTSARGTSKVSASWLITRKINFKVSAIKVTSMLGINSFFSFRSFSEFDKSNTFRLTLVSGNLKVDDSTVFLESVSYSVLISLERKVSNKDFSLRRVIIIFFFISIHVFIIFFTRILLFSSCFL